MRPIHFLQSSPTSKLSHLGRKCFCLSSSNVSGVVSFPLAFLWRVVFLGQTFALCFSLFIANLRILLKKQKGKGIQLKAAPDKCEFFFLSSLWNLSCGFLCFGALHYEFVIRFIKCRSCLTEEGLFSLKWLCSRLSSAELAKRTSWRYVIQKWRTLYYSWLKPEIKTTQVVLVTLRASPWRHYVQRWTLPTESGHWPESLLLRSGIPSGAICHFFQSIVHEDDSSVAYRKN
jgi:hypothetical protein